MFFFFIRYTLVDSLGTAYGKCCLCYIYLIVYVLYCIACVESYFYLCVVKEFGDYSYLFATACKGDPFCFVALRISAYICFRGRVGF